eukprot:Gb_12330 [translate_table: standard]
MDCSMWIHVMSHLQVAQNLGPQTWDAYMNHRIGAISGEL